MCPRERPRTRSESTLPPPSATTSARPALAEQLAHELLLDAPGRSPRRAARTPRRSGARGAARAARRCRARARRAPPASSRAALDLPAPMKPIRTSAIRSAARSARTRLEHVVDVVAAELLAVGLGEHEGDHRLADHPGRRHGARVGPLAQRLRRLVRLGVHRAQRLGQRRQRLHRAAHDQRLAGRHPALEPAGAVGLAEVAALGRVEDLVVGLRARQPRELERVAQRDALDRLDRADRHRQAPVEALLPGDVRAEPRDAARRPAPRRPRRATRWPGAARRSRATIAREASASRQRTGELVHLGEVRRRERTLARGRAPRRSASRASGRSTPERAAGTPCTARRPRRGPPSRARRPARGCCARRSACTSGCPPGRRGPDAGRWTSATSSDRPGAHPLLPVGVVAVGDLQRDRPAERAPVAHSARDLGAVALDLHAPAAAVAELAAGHVAVDRPPRTSSSPAGSPSTMHVRPGPWDSPAVIRRSDTAR